MIYVRLVVAIDEHIIKCSICGRSLIVKDTVNNGVAFLSHLKIDHGISYSVIQMTQLKDESKERRSNDQRYVLSSKEIAE